MTVATRAVGYVSDLSHHISRPATPLVSQLVLTPVAADNFNRANGTIAGANNWAATSGGSAVISSSTLISGGASPTVFGDSRTDAYNSNQYSRAVVTAGLSSGEWIGLAVRNQDAQNCYLGIWFNNAGSLQLQIFKLVAGVFTQLNGANTVGAAFPAGTVLMTVAEGNVIRLSDSLGNASAVIDTTFTGGTPGIQFFGLSGGVDNWDGGNAATTALSAASATDNFNRANGGVSVGQPNWQILTGYPAVDIPIVTNQLNPTTGSHAADVRTDAFSSDQWSSIQMGSAAMDTAGFTGALTRVNAGLNSGYLGVQFGDQAALGLSYRIYRLDAGASTLLAVAWAAASPALNDPAGSSYTLVSQGTRQSLRVNGSEILAVIDATYTSGKPGVMLFPTSSADNWTGGNV